MKFYEITLSFEELESETLYFTSLEAADAEIRRVKEDEKTMGIGLVSIELDTIELADLPPKQLLLATLNRKGFIRGGGRQVLLTYHNTGNGGSE